MDNSKYSNEPKVDYWDFINDNDLKLLLEDILDSKNSKIILIDGRSGSGKSYLGNKIGNLLKAPVVHTDDIAWNNHPINWDTEIKENIIKPWLNNENIEYRPKGWNETRKGAITLSRRSKFLIIEGVGAGRISLHTNNSILIWVQADAEKTFQRGILRDMKTEQRTKSEAVAFWNNWKMYEDPFLEEEKPWERADIVISGDGYGANKSTSKITRGPLFRN